MKQLIYLDLETLKAERVECTMEIAQTAVQARDAAESVGIFKDVKHANAVIIDEENKQTFHTDIDLDTLKTAADTKKDFDNLSDEEKEKQGREALGTVMTVGLLAFLADVLSPDEQ